VVEGISLDACHVPKTERRGSADAVCCRPLWLYQAFQCVGGAEVSKARALPTAAGSQGLPIFAWAVHLPCSTQDLGMRRLHRKRLCVRLECRSLHTRTLCCVVATVLRRVCCMICRPSADVHLTGGQRTRSNIDFIWHGGVYT